MGSSGWIGDGDCFLVDVEADVVRMDQDVLW